MKLIAIAAFSWSHGGVQVEHFEAGQEIETEDQDLITVSNVQGWAVPAEGAESASTSTVVTQPQRQVDVDALRAAEVRLADRDMQLREREEQLASREEALATAEVAFAEKQAASNAAPAAGDSGADAPQELDRDALKARATELGIEFARNVTTEKLAELIEAHKK